MFVYFFASENVLFYFRSYAPAINPVDLGRVFLIILDTLSMTGFLDRPSWWLPFPLFISFFQFCVKPSHGVYVPCLRGNMIFNFFAFRHRLNFG